MEEIETCDKDGDVWVIRFTMEQSFEKSPFLIGIYVTEMI